MIRSILSWSTALLVLCSGLLASCDDKDEGGGIRLLRLRNKRSSVYPALLNQTENLSTIATIYPTCGI